MADKDGRWEKIQGIRIIDDDDNDDDDNLFLIEPSANVA